MSATIKNSRMDSGVATYGGVPTGARLASEIVKPKDWPAFQRNCVVLFREELRDPNTKEYGRNGQDQGGIDILGYRNADPAHPVGVQCRRIDRSLKQAAILKDCRAALALDFGLRELIFATTAPDDTKVDKAAKAVERQLREEGHNLTVHVYGWGQLQTLIGIHEPAYNAFMPGVVASARPVEIEIDERLADPFAARIVDEMVRRGGLTIAPHPATVPAGPGNIGNESPALHAKIDVLRELVREGESRSTEQKLLALRDSPEAVNAPWARYRIETNVAAALMDRGLEAEAAQAYERAYLIRPDDPDALANLALARTIQGRAEEGMEIAKAVLARPDRTPFAVSALLQAAARTDWQGDPESLIPQDMRGTTSAELAVADFLRKRWLPGWEARVLALPDTETDFDNIARLKALAILSIAVDSRVHVVGGKEAVTDAQINEAADQMQAHALHCLRNGYALRYDLIAHVSNAALLLRMVGRQDEAETLLREGLRSVPDEDQLMRLLAMVLIDRGHRDEALKVLENGTEPETILMKVQFGPSGTVAERLWTLLDMGEPNNERVAGMRRRLIAELALIARDANAFHAVIRDMLVHPDDIVAAKLLEVENEKKSGLDEDEVRQRLRTIADGLEAETHLIDRFLVAEAMMQNGMEAAAAELIEGHVDLGSPRPATFLYFTALAEARRDEAFRTALQRAPIEVREHPDMLWLDARHAWNAGDVERSLADLDRMLEIKPGLPKAILMRIETLLRLGRSKQVLETLDEPIEDLEWMGGRDPFRVADLLSHFGHHERAARYAYRLFLQHRDRPRAWMTLSSMTIREGQDRSDRPSEWSPVVVANDVAVDVEYDDGGKLFFIVEPDQKLRTMDQESWEPDHSLVKVILGLGVDGKFEGPDGRGGRVTQLRHKIVARFHYVLANYENRFPEVFGLKSMTVDPERPDGLDDLIAQLKERHDWVMAEQEKHLASGLPIDVLASRLGADTIDVAAGLADQGIGLRVAAGTEPERRGAHAALVANERRGCVLDLLAFWTAWRLGMLDQVAAVCGPVTVARSVVDRLHARRGIYELSSGSGHASISYLDGRIMHTEVPPERMAQLRDDITAAIDWISSNDAARPLVLEESLSAALRDHVQSGRSDILDATVLSLTSGSMLVSDDLASRAMHAAVGGARSAWLHAVLTEAYDQGRISADDFTQLTVDLIRSGQSHLGISGTMIALGMQMDVLELGRLGDRATALASRLGGVEAEPHSHFASACGAIAQLWSTHSVRTVREKGTSIILENLIRERADWEPMIAALEKFATGYPGLEEYVRGWARGHFLPGYV